MNDITIELLTGLTVATTFVVEILKKLATKIVDGREEVFALFLPVLFGIAAKLTGNFADVGWFTLMLATVGTGVGSGLSHDYVLKGVPVIKKLFTRGAPAIVLLLMIGCGVPKEYLSADRATFNVIATEYTEYVEKDPALTDMEKKSRKVLVSSWDLRIRKNGEEK